MLQKCINCNILPSNIKLYGNQETSETTHEFCFARAKLEEADTRHDFLNHLHASFENNT